jgi:hypothetical protein
MLVIIAFLGGEEEVTCHLEFLTKNEAPAILKLSGKIFIGLQNF